MTAKSDVLKIKEEFENEMKERRREIQSSERRLAQKEENLDRKADSFEAKVKNVERKERDIDALKERLSAREDDMKKAIARQIDELERITELDRESAKTLLLEKLKGEVENECGILIRNIVDEAQTESGTRVAASAGSMQSSVMPANAPMNAPPPRFRCPAMK